MMKLARIAVAAWTLPLALTVGTGCQSGGSDDPTIANEPALTWHRDIKPIVDQNCVGCHTEGGIGPFTLEDYSVAYQFRDRIADQVENRVMPPWLAAPGCAEYQHDPSLAQEDIDTIVAWVDLGAPEGTPVEASEPEENEQGLSRVDLTLEMPEDYVQQVEPDDYRCFLIDWPADHTQFVTGFRANPGNPQVVHHVIAFLVGPDSVDTYREYDDAEPGPGYTCFGGPAGPGGQTDASGAGWIGAWAPGSQGSDFPEGTGMRIEPGSKIALQVHYNSQTAGTGPDLTSIDLRLADQVDKEAFTLPWANPMWLDGNGMSIPAGESDVTHSFAFDPTTFIGGSSFVIHSAALHMHQLGSRGTLKIDRADGSEECMLDVPRWDFHWQLAYGFTEPKVFNPGDRLSIECHWDNTEANQPIVRGAQQTPRDVAWGEGSTDEMCLGVFYVTGP